MCGQRCLWFAEPSAEDNFPHAARLRYVLDDCQCEKYSSLKQIAFNRSSQSFSDNPSFDIIKRIFYDYVYVVFYVEEILRNMQQPQ